MTVQEQIDQLRDENVRSASINRYHLADTFEKLNAVYLVARQINTNGLGGIYRELDDAIAALEES